MPCRFTEHRRDVGCRKLHYRGEHNFGCNSPIIFVRNVTGVGKYDASNRPTFSGVERVQLEALPTVTLQYSVSVWLTRCGNVIAGLSSMNQSLEVANEFFPPRCGCRIIRKSELSVAPRRRSFVRSRLVQAIEIVKDCGIDFHAKTYLAFAQ